MKPILPSRCTANLPDDLDQPHLVAELKMDGSRYVMYLGAKVDPYERQERNALLSRQLSKVDNKHVDKTANVPHLLDVDYDYLQGTVLDGEMFHTDFPTTQSIMGAGAGKAVETQKRIGLITYHAWDCTMFRGIDLRGKPLSERRKVLEAVIKRINNPNIKIVEQSPGSEALGRFLNVTEGGGEGLIIKDLRMGYGVGWSKMKKSYEVSCFISGYKPGNGKYKDQVGAIALSVYDENGKSIQIGFASGFVDAVRKEITNDQDGFLMKVVDVYAQEKPKGGRLRHPTFYRFRDDLNPEDATMEKLNDDMSKAAKNKRWRG